MRFCARLTRRSLLAATMGCRRFRLSVRGARSRAGTRSSQAARRTPPTTRRLCMLRLVRHCATRQTKPRTSAEPARSATQVSRKPLFSPAVLRPRLSLHTPLDKLLTPVCGSISVIRGWESERSFTNFQAQVAQKRSAIKGGSFHGDGSRADQGTAYRQAKSLGIKGRSKMNKGQLKPALARKAH